eukprot:TRINITY_DN10058_c0_g1_i2.p1 TRINITY_DN10058_c0_g1~~TRINITY_DN10058_c0_g1_i2.p1  ORF type:complete len:141 (-),score=32.57 TRINITY_DN10058_c0_g1_i2:296-682(-)
MDGGGVLCTAVPTPMLKVLAQNYPENQREKIEKAHRNHPEAWKHFKTDPACSEEMYWKELLQDSDIKESTEKLGEMLRDSIRCHTKVLGLARRCKESGLAVGILSNHSSVWFSSIVKKFELDKVFTTK